jgi:hypothetical protein
LDASAEAHWGALENRYFESVMSQISFETKIHCRTSSCSRQWEAALNESAMVSKWPRQELAAPLRNRDRDRIAANAGRDRARWGRSADEANCSLPGIKPSESGCGPATEFRDEAVLWREVGQRLFTLSKH